MRAEEADLAAARAQRLVVSRASSPHEICLLVPDETGYVTRFVAPYDAAAFGFPACPCSLTAATLVGETLLQLLLCSRSRARHGACQSLYIPSDLPMGRPETGCNSPRGDASRFEPFAPRFADGARAALLQARRSNIVADARTAFSKPIEQSRRFE